MLIHDGRVEECGSHSQLLETGVGPMYTELYQLYQSKYEKVQRHRLISMRGPSQEAGRWLVVDGFVCTKTCSMWNPMRAYIDKDNNIFLYNIFL